MYLPIPAEVEAIVSTIVDSAVRVHKALGPGLLEAVYEACLCHELSGRGVKFQRQISVPVVYEGLRLDAGLRIDLLVEDSVVVELKAVQASILLFDAQLLTYLKLTGKRLGLLINFDVPVLKEGIKRLVR